MKIDVFHPRDRSLDCINDAAKEGQLVRRSPHVGNVPAGDLALIHGLAAIGTKLSVELVDTIHGNDRYSKPRQLTLAQGAITLASLKQAHYRVVGACVASGEGVNSAQALGLASVKAGKSLADIHVEALRQVLPAEVNLERSSEYFSSLGPEVLKQSIIESAPVIDRTLRMIDAEGKIRETNEPDYDNIFGLGENPLAGTLPPLEAMMAMELVDAAVKANGGDARAMHVAGNDMDNYTSAPDVMDKVKQIAQKVASHLAIPSCVTVEYCLPTRSALLANPDFPDVLPSTNIQSQYDLLALEGVV